MAFINVLFCEISQNTHYATATPQQEKQWLATAELFYLNSVQYDMTKDDFNWDESTWKIDYRPPNASLGHVPTSSRRTARRKR